MEKRCYLDRSLPLHRRPQTLTKCVGPVTSCAGHLLYLTARIEGDLDFPDLQPSQVYIYLALERQHCVVLCCVVSRFSP
jgi:hypothetical protein